MNSKKKLVKFRSGLKIEDSWTFIPSEPPPDHLPARLTTAMGGPQATITLPEQNAVYTLHAYDTIIKVGGIWITLNAPALAALTEPAA